MYSHCQSKANGDCRSQAEIQTSGLTSSQSETRKFIFKIKVWHFPTNSQDSRKPSRFLWNTKFSCESPTKGHWQATPAQVDSSAHDCFFSGCKRLCPCGAQHHPDLFKCSPSSGGKLHFPRHFLGAHFPAGKCRWTSCGARRKCPASMLSCLTDVASFYHFAARGAWGCTSLQGSPDLWGGTLWSSWEWTVLLRSLQDFGILPGNTWQEKSTREVWLPSCPCLQGLCLGMSPTPCQRAASVPALLWDYTHIFWKWENSSNIHGHLQKRSPWE